MIQSDKRQAGFTLIESIMTLIIASLFGTMLFSYFAVANRSILSADAYQEGLDLHRVMENITSDYYMIFGREAFPQWEPLKAYSVNDIVVSKSFKFGRQFICDAEGISGDSEPAWRTSEGIAADDGGVTWKAYKGELDPFISKIEAQNGNGNNIDSYGQYQLKELRFIGFENNIETPVSADEPENLLKLTIGNEAGETITSLFITSY